VTSVDLDLYESGSRSTRQQLHGTAKESPGLTSTPSFIIPVLISGPLVSRAMAKGLPVPAAKQAEPCQSTPQRLIVSHRRGVNSQATASLVLSMTLWWYS
jgi:hypothetical protein